MQIGSSRFSRRQLECRIEQFFNASSLVVHNGFNGPYTRSYEIHGEKVSVESLEASAPRNRLVPAAVDSDGANSPLDWRSALQWLLIDLLRGGCRNGLE